MPIPSRWWSDARPHDRHAAGPAAGSDRRRPRLDRTVVEPLWLRAHLRGMTPRPVLVGALAAVTLLSSCSGAAEVTDAPEPSTESSPAARSDPSPSSNDVDTDPGAPSPSAPADLVLTQVRVAEHRGRDRVTLRLAGDGTPRVSARYVRRAVLEGSGDVVDLAGDTIVRLDVYGTPTRPAGTTRPVRTRVGGDVVEVRVVEAIEGISTVFLGRDGDRTPLRVSTSAAPSRVVVDLG